jgi:hypothetical protein
VEAAVRRALPLLAALAAVAAVVVSYLALGGASYAPTAVADPCVRRAWRNPGDVQAALEQVALSGLDGAACTLGVSREDLVLALRDESSLNAFATQHGLARADAEQAIHDGLVRSIDDAVAVGALPNLVAGLARRAVDAVPPWLLLDALERVRGLFP